MAANTLKRINNSLFGCISESIPHICKYTQKPPNAITADKIYSGNVPSAITLHAPVTSKIDGKIIFEQLNPIDENIFSINCSAPLCSIIPINV